MVYLLEVERKQMNLSPWKSLVCGWLFKNLVNKLLCTADISILRISISWFYKIQPNYCNRNTSEFVGWVQKLSFYTELRNAKYMKYSLRV